MTIRSLALAALLATATTAPAALADPALADALQEVSKEQIAAFNREDVAATMAYADTRSPSYEESGEALAAQFAEADARAELSSFQYVGHDDEFAVARVKVKVVAPGVEGFLDNVVDTFVFFHQEDGRWKVWDTYLLGAFLVE